MGEVTGFALKRAVQRRFEKAYLSGMIGKFSKIARGHFMTHVAGNRVEPVYLAELAAACGASSELQAMIAGANTARHVQELAQSHGLQALFQEIAIRTATSSRAYIGGALAVEAILFDFDGTVLGQAAAGNEA